MSIHRDFAAQFHVPGVRSATWPRLTARPARDLHRLAVHSEIAKTGYSTKRLNAIITDMRRTCRNGFVGDHRLDKS